MEVLGKTIIKEVRYNGEKVKIVRETEDGSEKVLICKQRPNDMFVQTMSLLKEHLALALDLPVHRLTVSGVKRGEKDSKDTWTIFGTIYSGSTGIENKVAALLYAPYTSDEAEEVKYWSEDAIANIFSFAGLALDYVNGDRYKEPSLFDVVEDDEYEDDEDEDDDLSSLWEV